MTIKKLTTIHSMATEITARAQEFAATRARHRQDENSLVRGWEEKTPGNKQLPAYHPAMDNHPANNEGNKLGREITVTDSEFHRRALDNARQVDKQRRVDARHDQETTETTQHAEVMVSAERDRALSGFENQYLRARQQVQLISEFAWLHEEISNFLNVVRRDRKIYLAELFRRFDQGRLADQKAFLLLLKRNLYTASESGALVRQAFSGRPAEEVAAEIALPIIRERNRLFAHHRLQNRWSIGDTGLLHRTPVTGDTMEQATFEASVPVMENRTDFFATRHVNNRWVIADAGALKRLAILGARLSQALATEEQPKRAERTREFLTEYYAQRYTITANDVMVPLFRLGHIAEHVAAERALPLVEQRTEAFADRRKDANAAHQHYRENQKDVVINESIRQLIYVNEERQSINGDLSARLAAEVSERHSEVRLEAQQNKHAAQQRYQEPTGYRVKPAAAKDPDRTAPLTPSEHKDRERTVHQDEHSVGESKERRAQLLAHRVEESAKQLASPFPLVVSSPRTHPDPFAAAPDAKLSPDSTQDNGTVKEIAPHNAVAKKAS